MPLLPIISAIAPAIGGAIQSAFGFRGQKKTNEANMELAKYAYSKDLEMWNRANVYNSPEAQMERLKNAGLNPNMVYGSGAVANSAGTLPKYNAPTLDYNYVPPVQDSMVGSLNQFQDFQIKQAQINNLREQNKVIRETGLQKEYLNRYYPSFATQKIERGMYAGDIARMEVEGKGLELEQKRGLFPSQLEFQKGKVRYQDAQILNLEKQGRKIDASTDYQNKVNEWYLTKMFSQLGMQAVNTLGNVTGTAGKVIGMSKTFKGSKANAKDAQNWRNFQKARQEAHTITY